MQKEGTALVFPGQGSQFVGMGAGFYAEKSTKELFEQADDTLHFHLTKLMLEGDASELTSTENTQPALLLCGIAAATYLQKQTGKPIEALCRFVAGHSLGEYTALCAAGSFDFETALQLVRKRGQAMQSAVTEGEGGMLALLGLPSDVVKEIADAAKCYVANDNSEGQVVLSGSLNTLETAQELASARGVKRAVMLDVSSPFHSPFMQSAAEVMAAELDAHKPQQSNVSVVMNIPAQVVDSAEQIKQNLVDQVVGSVRWRESMVYMAEREITQIYELGCGKVLTGLAKRCDRRLKGQALTSPKEIDEMLQAVNA